MWKSGTLVQQEATASTGVFGVGAANWCSPQKTFNWYAWRLTVKLTTSLLVWKGVEFSLNSRACSLCLSLTRIALNRAQATCAGDPMLRLHVDSWGGPRLCRSHQFALNLPETNNSHKAAAHSASSQLAVCQCCFCRLCFSLSLSICWFSLNLFPVSLLFPALHHTYSCWHCPEIPQKAKSASLKFKAGTFVLVVSKRKVNTSTNKQQVCRQVVKKSTSVQDFSGISVQTLRCKEARWLKAGDEGNMRKNKLWRSGCAKEAQHEASRWPTSDFPEEDSRNSSDK